VLLYLPHILGGVVVVIMYRFFVELAIPEIAGLFGKEIQGLLMNPNTLRPTIIFYTIYTSFGTQVLVYSSTMSGISDSLIESAELDGITPFKELIYIILPSIWPTFVTFMVSSVVGIFTNQMALYTFYGVGAPPKLSTFGYYLYRKVTVALPEDYPFLSALGLLLTFTAIPITLGARWALNKIGPSRE
jgi:ABC-type sugar transport system permease subunit